LHTICCFVTKHPTNTALTNAHLLLLLFCLLQAAHGVSWQAA
jgi:hypothetical protein